MSFRALFETMYSRKYLLVTNTITGTLFFTVGDVIEQQIIEKRVLKQTNDYRKDRTAVMCGIGTYFGFLGHFWYAFLDKRYPLSLSRSVAKKLTAEALIGPPFAASLFLLVGALEGKSMGKACEDLKRNLALLCLADWAFYVPLQAINFRYLPPKYRFLFVALISLIYDTFLSFVLHNNP